VTELVGLLGDVAQLGIEPVAGGPGIVRGWLGIFRAATLRGRNGRLQGGSVTYAPRPSSAASGTLDPPFLIDTRNNQLVVNR
jgi:hypothetical protein